MLGVPFGKMCVEAFERDRDRTLLRNIAYVGALAALLEIDMDVIHEALNEKFGKKKALLDANFTAIRLGYDYAKANFECPLPFHLERMNANADYVLMDGNTASALGAVYAGRDGRRVVSDHARDVADGSVHDVLRAVPRGPGDEGKEVLHHPGGGRALGGRHRDRRELGGRARVHVHGGPGHLADAGSSSASRTTPRRPRSSSTCSARARPRECRRARSRAT